MLNKLFEKNTKALAAIESMRNRVINTFLASSTVCYQTDDYEGHLFELHFRLIKACSGNHHCLKYLLIAQSVNDNRTGEEIIKLFESKMDLSNVEAIIEKYEVTSS